MGVQRPHAGHGEHIAREDTGSPEYEQIGGQRAERSDAARSVDVGDGDERRHGIKRARLEVASDRADQPPRPPDRRAQRGAVNVDQNRGDRDAAVTQPLCDPSTVRPSGGGENDAHG